MPDIDMIISSIPQAFICFQQALSSLHTRIRVAAENTQTHRYCPQVVTVLEGEEPRDAEECEASTIPTNLRVTRGSERWLLPGWTRQVSK